MSSNKITALSVLVLITGFIIMATVNQPVIAWVFIAIGTGVYGWSLYKQEMSDKDALNDALKHTTLVEKFRQQ